MKRSVYIAGLVCLGAIYSWAGIVDFMEAFDRSGRERLGYLFGTVAWIGVGGSAVLLTLTQLLSRYQDDGPVVRKIAAAQGSSSAFVFRASPGRKQLIRVAVIAFVVATVGNIAIGRSQTASNASQLIRWVL